MKIHKSFWQKISRHKILLIVCVAVLVLVTTQVERFINKGTIFGYQARTVATSAKVSQNPFALKTDPNQPHLACEKVTKEPVSKQLKTDVEVSPSLLPDRTTPNVVSSCIYRTKPAKNQPARSVTVLIRDLNTDDVAKKTMTSLIAGRSTEDIKNVGDEAVFVPASSQLTARKGRRLITVTVTKAQAGQPDSKVVASQLAKEALD